MKKFNLFLSVVLLCCALLLSSCGMAEDGVYYESSGGGSGSGFSYGSGTGDAVTEDVSFDADGSSESVESIPELSKKKSTMEEKSAELDGSESAESAERSSEAEEITEEEQNNLTAGQITCFAYNDNDHYADYKLLFQKGQNGDGKWVERVNSGELWGFDAMQRVKVTVLKGESKVSGAKVVASQTDGEGSFSAVTDSCGVAYLFPSFTEGTLTATSGEYQATGSFFESEREITLQLEDALSKSDLLEIMFVIDATGSMGDEMTYLQAEIADVVQTVYKRTNARINLAFLFYRDDGDQEKFAYSDFVNIKDSENYNKQQSFLKSQTAYGGGDYEEAVDEALSLAVNKQWSGGTKLIFHLHDAPPHSANKNKTLYKSAVDKAAELGIRICPILASGADSLTEYLARQSAIMTGGTDIYITDDSGIGGSHLDPSIPNVTVETLNECLVRIIEGYYTGTFVDPVAYQK